MKIKLILFLCLIFSISNAFTQNNYLDFIQTDPEIKWAAEYSQIFVITPKIRKFGIKQIYLRRNERSKDFSYSIFKEGEIYTKSYPSSDNLHSTIVTSTTNPFKEYFDRQLDGSQFLKNEKSCHCDGKNQVNKFDAYNIHQLLYYKNAKLYVKNILVNPICLRNMIDSGFDSIFEWQTCFSTYLNTTESDQEIDKTKFIDLGNYESIYNLKYDLEDSTQPATIHTKRNPVLSRLLYQDVGNGRVTLVDRDNQIIPANKYLTYGVPEDDIPTYDSDGNLIGVKKMALEINSDSIYYFSVNQHFYLDTIKNILHSKVNYVDIYRNLVTTQGLYLGKGLFYSIYFIKPSLYKKDKIKKY